MKLGFLEYLIGSFTRNKRMMVGLAGTAKNHFYYQSESRNHAFKRNQRKEKSLSRRRGMKLSAR